VKRPMCLTYIICRRRRATARNYIRSRLRSLGNHDGNTGFTDFTWHDPVSNRYLHAGAGTYLPAVSLVASGSDDEMSYLRQKIPSGGSRSRALRGYLPFQLEGTVSDGRLPNRTRGIVPLLFIHTRRKLFARLPASPYVVVHRLRRPSVAPTVSFLSVILSLCPIP